jgi:outer membrane protein assembly factor BamB
MLRRVFASLGVLATIAIGIWAAQQHLQDPPLQQDDHAFASKLASNPFSANDTSPPIDRPWMPTIDLATMVDRPDPAVLHSEFLPGGFDNGPGENPPSPQVTTVDQKLSVTTDNPSNRKPADQSQTKLGEDITEQVRQLNKNASWPKGFRSGSIELIRNHPAQVQRDKNGFVIKLPSNSPIPTPTVYNGRLYVSGGFHSRQFFCFDATTGEPVWSANLSDDGPSSAVCDDDVVVFNTESCTLFALDAKTGKHLWSHWLGDPLTSTPAIANGMVFTSYPAHGQVQGASHVFIALELKSGKILWQRWIDSDVLSAPVAVGDEVYATSFAGTVYRFKQKDGTIVSAHRRRATSAPTVVGEEIYCTQRADIDKGQNIKQAAEALVGLNKQSHEKGLFAALRAASYLDAKIQERSALQKQAASLDAANGFAGGAPPAANAKAAAENVGVFNVSTMQNFQGSRILYFRNQLFSSMGDRLVCVDPATGKERWQLAVKGDMLKLGGHLAAPPAAAGGLIVLASCDGNLLLIDPDKGTVRHSYTIKHPVRSQPAIVGGRIYAGTQDGRVVCINTGDPQLTGWYTWGGDMSHTNAVRE